MIVIEGLKKLYFANSSAALDLTLLNVQFPSRCVSSECKPFPIVNLIFLVTKEPLKLKLSNRLPINDDSDKLGENRLFFGLLFFVRELLKVVLLNQRLSRSIVVKLPY